jgi:imidazolonepropionase-like amidohydrolase
MEPDLSDTTLDRMRYGVAIMKAGCGSGLLLWCAISIVAPGPALGQANPDHLVFLRANVIDGASDRPLTNVTVVVRGGRIERVAREAVDPPLGATVIDLNGRWMLPGLIDTHVHLRALASARRALRSGVTTARSLGVNHFTDVGIGDLHRRGAIDLPDVVAGGYHVRRRLAEEFFLDAPQLLPFMNGVGGPDDVRRIVRELIKRRVNVVKLMATERAGLLDTDFRRRVLTDAELAAAADEAGRAGIPVAAHAHTDEAVRAAVRAGVRTVEHGTLVSPETLGLMRQAGTCYTPTLSFWEDMLDVGGEYSDTALATRAREMLPRARAAVAAAWKSKVKLTAGSDMRYEDDRHRGIADEIEALVVAGLPPIEAIRAATSTAAECLGIGQRTGSLAVGKEADAIVVDLNPLDDIRALRDIRIIVNNGRIAFDGLKR